VFQTTSPTADSSQYGRTCHADPYNPRPVWDNFRGLFNAIDQGSPGLKIEQYNGGLFAQTIFWTS
jgi:hypothetical protein